jgi:hypothetical protein
VRGAALLRRHEDEGVRQAVCPPEFASTDRIMMRWASSVGMGLQSDQWQDVELKSKAPPLDDHTSILVDTIVMKSPPKTKSFLMKWYRTNLPGDVIAEQLNLTPATLLTAWNMSLLFTQKRIVDTNDKSLLALLRFRE